MEINIRQETPADYDAVYRLVKEAFATADHSDGDEQDLVVRLRKSDAFIPQLSLVAETNGVPAGYILLTKIGVGEETELAAAPLAVAPAFQRKGVGSALIREAERAARELGYRYIVILGSPAYYGRFGYRPAVEYGIRPPFPVEPEYFMARPLMPGAEKLDGTVRYAPEFGIG